MYRLEKVLSRKESIGNFSTEHYQFRLEDGTLLDNSYYTVVYDKNGNIIEKNLSLINIPDLEPRTYALDRAKPANTVYDEPVLIDLNNEFWKFEIPIQTRVWIVEENNNQIAIDYKTHRVIARGTPIPASCGYLWEGTDDDGTSVWGSYITNAYSWFSYLSSIDVSFAPTTRETVLENIRNKYHEFYYAIAHGNASSATVTPGSYLWSGNKWFPEYTVQNAMKDRQPMRLAFLCHCGAMDKTEPYYIEEMDAWIYPFSYVFRKGEQVDTAVIGYKNMTQEAWTSAFGWQNRLLEKVFEYGYTFKDAYDFATASYPAMTDHSAFDGDPGIGAYRDVEIDLFEIDKSSPGKNESVTFTIHISNTTGSNLTKTLRLIDDGEEIYSEVVSINSYDILTREIDKQFDRAGRHFICCEVK